jgi:hypothetical protein
MMSSLKYLAGILASSLTLSVFAAPVTIDLRAGQTDDTYLNSRSYTVSGINLTVTGWSNNNTSVVKDKVGKWSGGLGVEREGVPGHALDSQNGDYDMLLLSFSSAVTLNSIDLGWIYDNDNQRSDVSILAGTNALVAGTSWASLLTAPNGWQSAGNYNNVGLSQKTVNGSAISAMYWLIGAYNPNIAIDVNIANNDNKYEAFKLEKVSVTQTVKVPEPSAVLLFGLGLLGLVVARRRTR